MHRVVVLALDGVIPFDLGVPTRLFGLAEGPDGEPLYEVLVCSVDGREVESSAGFGVAVKHDARLVATADTLVVPPTSALGEVRENGRLPVALAEVFDQIRPHTRVVSICTASYLLAAAGLLDGRRVAIHWREADTFRRTFPWVRVEENVLFVDSGDVLTSAGVAAGVDLCLHLIRRDHGSAVANDLARKSLVAPWRDGGQPQYVGRPAVVAPPAATAGTQAWALARLDNPLTLADLAAHARMSVRTFTRRFRAESGVTPGQWLIARRIELARHLLETSDLPIDGVALRAGFGAANSMRRHMRTALGVSPATYRRTFRANVIGRAEHVGRRV